MSIDKETAKKIAGGLLYVAIPGCFGAWASAIARLSGLSTDGRIVISVLVTAALAFYAAKHWLDEASAQSVIVGVLSHAVMVVLYGYQVFSDEGAVQPFLLGIGMGYAVFMGSHGRMEGDTSAMTFLWGVFATAAQLALALYFATARIEPVMLAMLATLGLLGPLWLAMRAKMHEPQASKTPIDWRQAFLRFISG